ncbi:MAG: FeoA family protein [Oscillatoria sp. PMC 1050.18]|nr:FeoA family protein [Oscillatoria sp. PMC 1050.18]
MKSSKLENRRRTIFRRKRNNKQHRHQNRRGHQTGEVSNPEQRSIMPLAKAEIGDRLWIAGYKSKDGINRLLGMGLAPGMAIQVLQNLAGNIVVGLGDSRIGIDGGMAKRILVSDRPFDYLVEVQEVNDMETQKTTLKDLQLNQQAKVAGYEATDSSTQKAYKKKLLAMGLTPGTEFTVTRVAPLGDPVEILVRGFKLSLRKDEAAALVVEALD